MSCLRLSQNVLSVQNTVHLLGFPRLVGHRLGDRKSAARRGMLTVCAKSHVVILGEDVRRETRPMTDPWGPRLKAALGADAKSFFSVTEQRQAIWGNPTPSKNSTDDNPQEVFREDVHGIWIPAAMLAPLGPVITRLPMRVS